MGIIVEAGAVASGLLTARSASAYSRALGTAALITWLIAAGIGAYMLATVISGGGVRKQRATGDKLPPLVLFGHFGLAITGLMVWVSFLASGYAALAWSAVGLLMLVIGLGISTVTLWTPFPGPRAEGPAGHAPATPTDAMLASRLTDDVLASALTDDVLASKLVDDAVARVLTGPPPAARKPRWRLAPLIPAGHGVAAVATFLLAVLTAVGTR